LLTTFSSAIGQNNEFPKYVPDATTVCIVPVVNRSAEKHAQFKARQSEAGADELIKEFSMRGFKLVDEAIITRAMSDLKIDMNDTASFNTATLTKIGKSVNADLTVFVVITAVEQHSNVEGNDVNGKAKVTLWLIDNKNPAPLLNGVTKEGVSYGWLGALGTAMIRHAVANGERNLLNDFFKPYPVKKGRG